MPLTIIEAGRALRAGTVSSVELVRRGLASADALDETLGVFNRRFDEAALEAAAGADRELARGIDRGPLHGIPIGVKDIVATREAPTSGNSEVVRPSWNEPRDAPVVARLREAGAVIPGKLSTMEFAIGVPDASKSFPIPRNPWDPDCYPGGSSSGSGAGIPAEMFLGAVGTDTAGSIRIPAAYCGITGLKGTNGLVSRSGVIPLGPSLDVVGPMARTAADAAAMLQAMAGFDPTDPASSDVGVAAFSGRIGMSLEGLRVGVERKNHLYGELVDPELPTVFEDAVLVLERAGASVREVELPYYREVTDGVLLTMFSEGLAVHHRELREQWERYGSSARLAFAAGTFFSAHEYVVAQKVRRMAQRIVDRLFEDVDVIVCPTTATAAPKVEGLDLSRIIATLFTNFWSGVRSPTVSIPMGFSGNGLPYGLQIAGRAFEDALVLGVADAYQRATEWHTRTPPLVAAIRENGDDGNPA